MEGEDDKLDRLQAEARELKQKGASLKAQLKKAKELRAGRAEMAAVDLHEACGLDLVCPVQLQGPGGNQVLDHHWEKTEVA